MSKSVAVSEEVYAAKDHVSVEEFVLIPLAHRGVSRQFIDSRAKLVDADFDCAQGQVPCVESKEHSGL
jgi:hypothetical protein